MIAETYVNGTLDQLLSWAESAEALARSRAGQPDGRQWAEIARKRREQYEKAKAIVEAK